MDDLIAFLRARLDEDERTARAVSPCYPPDDPLAITEDLAHATRWGPARVLAEVEAKRRMVDLHQPAMDGGGRTSCSSCGELNCCSEPWPCPTARLLALPYAEGPDYRPEWRV